MKSTTVGAHNTLGLIDTVVSLCQMGHMYHCIHAVQLPAISLTEAYYLHGHLKTSGISNILGFLSVPPGLEFPYSLHFCLCASIKIIHFFFVPKRCKSTLDRVNKAKLVQNFSFYVYFFSLHVSGNYVPIIRRNNSIYMTHGTCYSVWMTGQELDSSHPVTSTIGCSYSFTNARCCGYSDMQSGIQM